MFEYCLNNVYYIIFIILLLFIIINKVHLDSAQQTPGREE